MSLISAQTGFKQMALGQEGIAGVATAAVLHPISLPQWQQQNWLQPS